MRAFVDKVYENASVILTKGFFPEDERTFPKTEIGKAYIKAYSYVCIMLLGFVGMLRFYRKEQRVILVPVLTYVLLPVFLASFKLKHRAFVEPLFIVYLAILVANFKRVFVPGDQAERMR
jgi:hypothetical protein